MPDDVNKLSLCCTGGRLTGSLVFRGGRILIGDSKNCELGMLRDTCSCPGTKKTVPGRWDRLRGEEQSPMLFNSISSDCGVKSLALGLVVRVLLAMEWVKEGLAAEEGRELLLVVLTGSRTGGTRMTGLEVWTGEVEV